MAEEIEIVNVGGDGGVASEATLRALVETLERMSDNRGADRKKQREEVERLNEATKNLIDTFDELEESAEDLNDSMDRTSRFTSQLGGIIGTLISGVTSVVGGMSNFAEELVNGSDRITDFSRHVPFVGDQLATLTQVIDDAVDNFRMLAGVGVDFGGSIFEVTRQAAQAGLSLETFRETIINNSESLALFGGNARQGARIFTQISGILQKDFGRQLSALGFTMAETAEYTADYLDLQVRLGRTQRRDSRTLAEGTAGYIMMLDRLTKVTGKRREQVEQDLESIRQDEVFASFLSTLDDETSTNIQEALTVLPQGLQDGLKNMFVFGGNIASEEAATLAQAIRSAGGDVGQFQSIVQGITDGTQTEAEMFEFIRNMVAGMDDETRERLAQLGSISNAPEFARVAASFLSLAEVGSELTDAEAAQAAAKERENASLLDFERTLTQIRNRIKIALIDSGIFVALENSVSRVTAIIGDPTTIQNLERGLFHLTSFVKKLSIDPGAAVNDLLSTIADAFLDWFLGENTRTIMQPGIGEVEVEQERTGGFWQTTLVPLLGSMFDSLKESMMSGIRSLWENTYIIEGMVAGIAALWAAPAVVSAVAGGLVRSATSRTAGAGAGGLLSRLFSGAGLRMFGAIGSGAMLYDMNKQQSRAFSEGGTEAVVDLQRQRQENMLSGIESIPGLGSLIDGYEQVFEMIHGVRPARTTLETEEDQLARLAEARENALGRIQRSLTSENEFMFGERRGRERTLEFINELNSQIEQLGGSSVNIDIGPDGPSVQEMVQEKWSKVETWFNDMLELTTSGISTAWNDLTTFVSGIWTNVETWFDNKLEWAVETLSPAWNDLTTFVSGIWTNVETWFDNKLNWSERSIGRGWTTLTNATNIAWTSASTWLNSALEYVANDEDRQFLQNLFDTTIESLTTFFSNVFDFLPSLTEIKSRLSSLLPSFLQRGNNNNERSRLEQEIQEQRERLASAESSVTSATNNRSRSNASREASQARLQLERLEEQLASLPQGAEGGIFNMPDSGHLAMLHGQEAVIPLDSPIAKQLFNIESDISSASSDMVDAVISSRNTTQPSNNLNDIISDLNNSNQTANQYLERLSTVNQDSSEALRELNTLIRQSNVFLQQIKTVDDKIERNTASSNNDISSGRVSRIR